MAISASGEQGELVLTSTRTNLEAAIAGLLNGIVAHSLPAGMPAPLPGSLACDRSTSVAAQATGLPEALTGVIEHLLDAIDTCDGSITGVEIHGVMTGRDRCTIWGQACLDAPRPYRPFELRAVTVDQSPGEISISATLRAGG